MTPAHRLLESGIRPAPVGLRFRDVATGQPVRDSLSVTVTPMRNPGRKFALERNSNGVWFAHRFSGLSDATLVSADDWSAIAQPCRIEVGDGLGRFLPLVLDMNLPVRGLATWPGWGALPAAPLAPLAVTDISVSPPIKTVCDGELALFSSPGRAAPAPLAEIRAQLAFAVTEAPAAWALLTASHGGQVRGIGQADHKGRVVVYFPYPERPRPSLATSPPAITDFRWAIDLNAYASGLPAGTPPEFGAIMDQLNRPRDLYADTRSPLASLPPQLLSLGKPVVLRTANTPRGPTSLLMMRAP